MNEQEITKWMDRLYGTKRYAALEASRRAYLTETLLPAAIELAEGMLGDQIFAAFIKGLFKDRIIIDALIELAIYVGYSIMPAYKLGYGSGEDKGRRDMQKFMCEDLR